MGKKRTGLTADQSPCCAAICGCAQLVVEPVFLSATHHASSGVIGQRVDVICVPVQICDGTVIVSSVEHDQIEQAANAEASPNTQVVVHFHLSDWHPLEICAHRIHLTLID